MRRRFDHWTLRYFRDRAAVWLYEVRHPDAPWLTADAIAILASALRPSDVGLEWGSGRSTVWFAQRTRCLTSIESSPEWHSRISKRLTISRLTNVDHRLLPAQETQHADLDVKARRYIEGSAHLARGSLDYVLVDGLFRAQCALRATELLMTGGILVVDNANWYLQRASRSPLSLKGPPDQNWAEFGARVAHWRLIWTTNGVTDTAVWIKPA